MKILIIGSGGREYSIGLALKNDKNVEKIYFSPGNGATDMLGENLTIKDYAELADFAKEYVDITVVGPEQPLVEGIVDIFREKGLLIFGPTKEAAQLEGSKAYMKNFISKYNVPTARYIETTEYEKAAEFIEKLEAPIVVKADGLCAGKGVIIALSREEALEAAKDMLSGSSFGNAGTKVVVEEFLDGFELSVFAISDGESYKILPACQDHKRLLDGNEGPNTGGMGAYAPTPLATQELLQKIEERIIKPSIDGMANEGVPFEGVLFCGIMVVKNEPYLLEFNTRFGDPECEVLMPLLKSSPSELFMSCVKKELSTHKIEFLESSAIGVVIASKDYPYSNSEPAKITTPKDGENMLISYAGVAKKEDGIYATGGRVLVSVGIGSDIKEARERAYKQIDSISFDGMKYRNDIAHEVL